MSGPGDKLGASEIGSLRILASALLDLAIQVLADEQEAIEEAEAA